MDSLKRAYQFIKNAKIPDFINDIFFQVFLFWSLLALHGIFEQISANAYYAQIQLYDSHARAGMLLREIFFFLFFTSIFLCLVYASIKNKNLLRNITSMVCVIILFYIFIFTNDRITIIIILLPLIANSVILHGIFRHRYFYEKIPIIFAIGFFVGCLAGLWTAIFGATFYQPAAWLVWFLYTAYIFWCVWRERHKTILSEEKQEDTSESEN